MSGLPEAVDTANGTAEAGGPQLWAALARSETGASHVRHDIKCQDHSTAKIIDADGRWTDHGRGTWAYAIVADGHGGVEHFRSHFGAVLAVEAMTTAFLGFRKQLVAAPASARGAMVADRLCLDVWRATAARLVVAEWRHFVYDHLVRQPPDERAPEPELDRLLADVCRRYGGEHERRLLAQIAAFREHAREVGGPEGLHDAAESGTAPLPLPDDSRWKRDEWGDWHASAYGATLLGVLVGPEALYWLRIGDGAMVQIIGGEAVELSTPPDDAIANQTPSLSDDRAVDRAEVGAVPLVDGTLPSAVVLATDGVPNSFNEPEGFLEFCKEVARHVASDRAAVEGRMPHWLAELSRRGSGDDTSVAMTWSTGGTEAEAGRSGRGDQC